MSEIKLVKCKPALVMEALRSYKLDTGGSLKAQVERLSAHVNSLTGLINIATCDQCGGDSDMDAPACPYCGDLGSVDPVAVDSTPPSAVEPETAQAATPEEPEQTEEELEHEDQPEDEDDTEAAPSAEVVDFTQDDEDELDPEDDSPPEDDDISAADEPTDDQAVSDQQEDSVASKKVTKVQTKKKATKAAPAAKTLRSIEGGKSKKAAKAPAKKAAKDPTEIVRTAPAPHGDLDAIDVAEGKTLADLQEQVEIIREAVQAGAEALHHMGSAAQEIIQSGLWKLVADKTGKPIYRSFKQYAVEELKISPTHIYRAIDTAKAFTVEELKGLSGQQVRVVLQVPPEDRKKLLDAAKKGASTAQLTDRANALRGGAKELPPPKKGVTVAVALGHQQMKLYKRPDGNGRIGDTVNAKPAASIKDAPWGQIDLPNKVRLIFKIKTNAQGKLVADVEFRRGESAL